MAAVETLADVLANYRYDLFSDQLYLFRLLRDVDRL